MYEDNEPKIVLTFGTSTVTYFPERQYNNLGIQRSGSDVMHMGGEVKAQPDGKYTYHPYGQNLEADDLMNINQLFGLLIKESRT